MKKKNISEQIFEFVSEFVTERQTRSDLKKNDEKHWILKNVDTNIDNFWRKFLFSDCMAG